MHFIGQIHTLYIYKYVYSPKTGDRSCWNRLENYPSRFEYLDSIGTSRPSLFEWGAAWMGLFRVVFSRSCRARFTSSTKGWQKTTDRITRDELRTHLHIYRMVSDNLGWMCRSEKRDCWAFWLVVIRFSARRCCLLVWCKRYSIEHGTLLNWNVCCVVRCCLLFVYNTHFRQKI